jgi:hypothetical protein
MGGAGEAVNLNLYKLFYPGNGVGNISLSFGAVSKDKTGDFEFRGVPQGSYTLRLINYPKGIPVNLDGDIEDLRIPADDHAQVAAHVTVDGGDETHLQNLSVRFANGESSFTPKARADNTFFADLYPTRIRSISIRASSSKASARTEQTSFRMASQSPLAARRRSKSCWRRTARKWTA